MSQESDHVDVDAAIERLRNGGRYGRIAGLVFFLFGTVAAIASWQIEGEVRWMAFGFALGMAVLGAIMVILSATPRLLARVHYWSERVSLPRDAPSSDRQCARCGRPLQSATWPSVGFPRAQDPGAVCGRCGGVREPRQRLTDTEQRRDGVRRWLDDDASR